MPQTPPRLILGLEYNYPDIGGEKSAGHLKRSFSRLFYNRQKPFFSQYRILTLSRRLLVNTYRTGAKGSSCNVCSTSSDNPAIDFLKSTVCVHRNTCGTLSAGLIIDAHPCAITVMTATADPVRSRTRVMHLIV